VYASAQTAAEREITMTKPETPTEPVGLVGRFFHIFGS
jgi:hypothetical protein